MARSTPSKTAAPLRAIERRLVVLLVFFSLIAIMLMFRVTWLQAVDGDQLRKKAMNQRLHEISLPAQRGRIFDRNGNELATSIPAKAVVANPFFIKKKKTVAGKISAILGLDRNEVEAKLRRDTGFVYIARQVPLEQADKVKKLKLPGISFLDESKRVYPADGLASQTIGFTNIDGKGIAGLEQYHDKVLGGRPGKLLAEWDPRGRVIPGGTYLRKPPVIGKDIQLTIDHDIQYEMQKALWRAYKKRKAKSVSAILMEVKTGEILAIASQPSFNPNIVKSRKPKNIRNRVLTDVYEPGSTFKTAVIAGAIEDGIVSPDDSMYLPPRIRVGDRWIGEAHGRAGQVFSVRRIIAESSNVGAVTIGLRMGKQSLYDWVSEWGFNRPTGIDFPGAAVGFLPKPKDWSQSTIGNIPIGQGIAISPLSLLRAVAAMSNGGVMVTPHLTKSVAGRPNRVDPPRRVISAATASKMLSMLEGVVTKGTGDRAAIPGYRVAGKTGTAQKARTDGRGYEKGKYVSSFVGVAPVSDPQIAIIVLVDESKVEYYGGAVAAPVFADIGRFALRKLKIMPDAPREGVNPADSKVQD